MNDIRTLPIPFSHAFTAHLVVVLYLGKKHQSDFREANVLCKGVYQMAAVLRLAALLHGRSGRRGLKDYDVVKVSGAGILKIAHVVGSLVFNLFLGGKTLQAAVKFNSTR